MTDRELIRRIRSGETSLMEELIAAHYDDVWRFCLYKTGREGAAYDLTQETFARFLLHFDQYREQGKLRAYLFRLAMNLLCDGWRAHPEVLPLPEEEEAQEGFEEELFLRDAVERAMARLPEIQRDVIHLHYWEGMKLSEIAAILDIGLPTVKSRLKQGRDKLFNYLKEEGLP